MEVAYFLTQLKAQTYRQTVIPPKNQCMNK
jgi:hypothetical protein